MLRKTIMTVLFLSLFAMTTLGAAEEVYVTKNGTKYHKELCRFIKNKGAEKIDLQDAITKGLKACHKCYPDSVASAQKIEKQTKKQVTSSTKN